MEGRAPSHPVDIGHDGASFSKSNGRDKIYFPENEKRGSRRVSKFDLKGSEIRG